jgi:hypothetical protein
MDNTEENKKSNEDNKIEDNKAEEKEDKEDKEVKLDITDEVKLESKD